ncbi:MAG: hypothetical protein CMJ47_00540 [Planctomyces sp.]|nr:hypothetical protein [Planctomyces sp.]
MHALNRSPRGIARDDVARTTSQSVQSRQTTDATSFASVAGQKRSDRINARINPAAAWQALLEAAIEMRARPPVTGQINHDDRLDAQPE